MISQINLAFQKCKTENRPALITYTVAGDNTKRKSLEILKSISEYAEINIAEIWDKGRNPIRYIQTSNLEKEFGVNLNNLEFKKVPDRDFTKINQINRETEAYYKMNINNKKLFVTETNDQGLSIQEAKEKLAIRFGVTEDNIEIIIKG